MTVVFRMQLQHGNTGVERTPSKSQRTKFTLEKKILPPLLPGSELAIFRSRVRFSYQQAIAAPESDRPLNDQLTVNQSKEKARVGYDRLSGLTEELKRR